MSFTTRPELRGTFGMVASTHWLASAAGMSVLERGGNAFDAAVATGLTLQVVEPHLNGPGGEVPALLFPVDRGEPIALCGQGVRARRGDDRALPRARPRARSRDRRARGLRPRRLRRLAAAAGAVRDVAARGRARVRDRLRRARLPARRRDPRDDRAAPRSCCAEWPGSSDLYLPAPEVGALFRNPALAATYRRIVEESRGGSREQEIEKARRAYYEGFVAEEIDRFSAAEGGLLTGEDMARWRATLEPVARLEYGGLTVCKTLPWAAGPVGLQQLALLDGFDLAELSPAEFVHVVTECAKLAFADRDALYGDGEVPLETLLSKAYNDERRALVGEDASEEYRPGIGRLPHLVEAAVTPGAGEPTRGDTVHLDVVDRHGNMFSATPSGGWLQSSPVIPSLGWPLGTRAQMFWLEEGLASSLRPGARPRTTLCPGLALRDGKPYLAWGTPGGDQQEQWALHVFVRHVDLGLNLQEAIDAPEFHMDHLISSFYPRGFARRSVTVEERFGDDVVDDLRARGHDVEVSGPWTLGRVTAVAREDDGLLKAGANPRGMQGYAAGR